MEEAMSQATVESIASHIVVTLTVPEIQSLADRLFSRGVSTLSTCDRTCHRDLLAASRRIRELLRRHERANDRQLEAIMIQGGA
jgi:hypothetical protein